MLLHSFAERRSWTESKEEGKIKNAQKKSNFKKENSIRVKTSAQEWCIITSLTARNFFARYGGKDVLGC